MQRRDDAASRRWREGPVDSNTPDATTAPEDQLARGRKRMREIAAEDEAKRQRLVTELLECLGRVPTALDRENIKTLAASLVRAERLRSVGRSDLEERRLIVQQQRALGMKSVSAASVEAQPDRGA